MDTKEPAQSSKRLDEGKVAAAVGGVGVAAAPWMNTFMPLVMCDTTASAEVARDFQVCMECLWLLRYLGPQERNPCPVHS